MEKKKVVLFTIVVVVILLIVLTFLQININNKLTALMVGDAIGGEGISSSVPYIIASLVLLFVAMFLIKLYFFPQIKFFKIMGLKPEEAFESLLLQLKVAINRGDNEKANSIASKIKHLYDHLDDDKKVFYRSKIKGMERYIN